MDAGTGVYRGIDNAHPSMNEHFIMWLHEIVCL